MHACLVIPEQPRESFILRLADGFESLAVKPLHFQRSKQGLAGSVVPAVALATHRSCDAAPLKNLGELMTGVLAAAIAMEDLRCLPIGTPPQPCHLQRVDDQAAAHLRLHRPAHDAAAEQIDNHGQQEPTLAGWNVRDVAGPRLVGR